MICKSYYIGNNIICVGVLAYYPQPRIVQIPTRGNLLNALSQQTTKSRFDITKLAKKRIVLQEYAYYLRFNKKCIFHTSCEKTYNVCI